MDEIHSIDRLAKSGANEFCNLTIEEVRARSPDVSKMAKIHIDRNTVVFYNPAKTTAKRIRDNYNNYIKHKKKQWIKKDDITPI
ncbi:MAG: hypothetical protein SNI70_10445 [Rikenellaceae bacterium]